VARVFEAISDIDRAAWNALDLGGSPFLRHEFLAALEDTGCVGRRTGWSPSYLGLYRADALIGAVPLFRKDHSWGEFVFDWSWANAYARLGLDYYPKLLSAVPFTPAPGPRLLVRPGSEAAQTRELLVEALCEVARETECSSVHVLFAEDDERALLQDKHFLLRKDCQFHWHNRGFKTFEDFIATFRADKRKKALRERRRVSEEGITFTTLAGDEIDDALWLVIFGFSEATFQARGHEHYLNVRFFRSIAASMPKSIMVKLAWRRERPVACAIFFRSDDTLYGRYWGTSAEFHSLHFETCYYQGIEYCIEQGLQRFEPGTQGEHKIARGFEPIATYSMHWMADPRFTRILAAHLKEERDAIDGYINAAAEHIPFHRDRLGS
jgi:predicted N-acyltransferase